MWFKKKSVLQADHHYDTEKSADGTNMYITKTTYSKACFYGRPSATDIGNYFFLPALGHYIGPHLTDPAYIGYYWSSTPVPTYNNIAYDMEFTNSDVKITTSYAANGFRVSRFE